MVQTNTVERGAAARIFTEQPERLAAAWRRERFTEAGKRLPPDNLLDGCVEDFIRQIGHSLRGAPTPAWSRTRGVLRLSLVRGTRGLYEEFGALRRCLIDAMHVVDSTPAEQQVVVQCIDQAVDSSIANLRRLEDPGAAGATVKFGGLVVELVEPQPRPAATTQPMRVVAPVAPAH